jgi:hypothetical protein
MVDHDPELEIDARFAGVTTKPSFTSSWMLRRKVGPMNCCLKKWMKYFRWEFPRLLDGKFLFEQ